MHISNLSDMAGKAAIHLLACAALLQGISADDGLQARAIRLMESSPLVDTHVDLPQILRSLCKNTQTLTPRRTPALMNLQTIAPSRQSAS